MRFYGESVGKKIPSSYVGIVLFMFSRPGPLIVLLAMLVFLAEKFSIGWSAIDFFVIFIFFYLRGILEWGLHKYVWHSAWLPSPNIKIIRYIAGEHIRHHKNFSDTQNIFLSGASVFAASLGFFLMTFLVFRGLSLLDS